MSSGFQFVTCHYCTNAEEFPDEHTPEGVYVCEDCFPIVSARSGE